MKPATRSLIHDISRAVRTGGISVMTMPKVEELSIGVGSALQPAPGFNTYAHRIIREQGVKRLGENVARLVYEQGFEATTSLSVEEVATGRGYIQMEYHGKCAEFVDSIVPPLTDEQKEDFRAGVRDYGQTADDQQGLDEFPFRIAESDDPNDGWRETEN